MRKPSLLATIPALVVMAAATSRCNPVDQGTDTDNHSTRPVPLEPAAQKALAAVSTVHDHKMVQRAGERVVYHPGWSSRIAVMDVGGRHREIYQQTGPYYGSRPREVVLGFRDVALTVFDPNHRIAGIKVETLDGQVWSLDEITPLCPPNCPEGAVPPSTPTRSLAPTAAPLEHARLALAPAERARASVSTGPEHRVAQAAGERVTYHPGWSSRIARVDAAGRRQEIYRQTQVYYGSRPREVALAFRDVALGVFDPNHRIRGITVETLDGQVWSLDEVGVLCPPVCPTPPDDAGF
jgi:hypothetical protein